MKKRRKALGFSQAVLAEKVDTSTTYIAQIEQKMKFPSAEMLERIAGALELDSLELFITDPFPDEALNSFHEGIKEDMLERLKSLMKARM